MCIIEILKTNMVSLLHSYISILFQKLNCYRFENTRNVVICCILESNPF